MGQLVRPRERTSLTFADDDLPFDRSHDLIVFSYRLGISRVSDIEYQLRSLSPRTSGRAYARPLSRSLVWSKSGLSRFASQMI